MKNKQMYIYFEETKLMKEPILSDIFLRQMCLCIIETLLKENEITEKEYRICMEQLHAK